jgi:hypothetical protein
MQEDGCWKGNDSVARASDHHFAEGSAVVGRPSFVGSSRGADYVKGRKSVQPRNRNLASRLEREALTTGLPLSCCSYMCICLYLLFDARSVNQGKAIPHLPFDIVWATSVKLFLVQRCTLDDLRVPLSL